MHTSGGGTRRRGRMLRVITLLSSGVVAWPGGARAQSGAWIAYEAARGAPEVRACLDTLPASALARSIVYAEIVPTGGTIVPEYVAAGDEIAREIAASLRKSIGGDTAYVRPGDSLVTWRALGATIPLTLHRDGSVRMERLSPFVNDARKPGLALLERGVLSAIDTLHAFAKLGAGVPDFSVVELHFIAPTFDSEGHPDTLSAHAPFPVMSLPIPWAEMPRARHKPRIDYPDWLRNSFAMGGVTLRFDIDEHGQVDSASVHPVWQAREPEPSSGVALHAYTTMLDISRRALPDFGYRPARIGGCPLRMTFLQSFEYTVHY